MKNGTLELIVPTTCRGRNLARKDVLEKEADVTLHLYLHPENPDSLVTAEIYCPYRSSGGNSCEASKSSGVVCKYELTYPVSNDQLVETIMRLNGRIR